jgi:hypothetical protein
MKTRGWRLPSMQSRGWSSPSMRSRGWRSSRRKQDAKQYELGVDVDCGAAAQGKQGEAPARSDGGEARLS